VRSEKKGGGIRGKGDEGMKSGKWRKK